MMTRLLTAAAAVALIAAPAAAQTIRITTAGKSTVELSTEIRAAAREVCWANYSAMPMPLEAISSCVSAQVKSAQAQLTSGGQALLSTDTILR